MAAHLNDLSGYFLSRCPDCHRPRVHEIFCVGLIAIESCNTRGCPGSFDVLTAPLIEELEREEPTPERVHAATFLRKVTQKSGGGVMRYVILFFLLTCSVAAQLPGRTDSLGNFVTYVIVDEVALDTLDHLEMHKMVDSTRYKLVKTYVDPPDAKCITCIRYVVERTRYMLCRLISDRWRESYRLEPIGEIIVVKSGRE